MSQNILLPELGEGVTEGELVKWLVSKGDSIQIDQPVAEVMTDKASMEVPSPLDGVVESFSAKEGDTIQVGDTLLVIRASEGKVESAKEEQKGKETIQNLDSRPTPSQGQALRGNDSLREKDSKEEKSSASAVLKSIPPVKPPEPDATDMDEDSSVLATPFTRKLAKEIGVSLHQIKGSGLAGRITKEDVLKYKNKTRGNLEGKSVSVNPVSGFSIPQEEGQERQALKGIRKKIADKMQLSKAVIPHFTLMDSANVDQLDKVKNSVKEMLKDQEIKVTYLSFVMKALLQTVKEFPELNAGIDDFSKEIVVKKYYNFGFAADTPRGLLVPVIKDVDKKSLLEISQEIQNLAEKARTGNISPEDMSGGTITITNIGSLGGEYATPIINAPEVAILGMYRLYVKPHWDGTAFKPQKTMNFSFTCDHRLIDGAVSARVLKYFIHKIENPLNIFI